MHKPDWKWVTFPVFAAFVFGALIAAFLDRPETDLMVGMRILLVLLGAYCFIHIVVAYLILPRRAASASTKARRSREEYEDELVYEEKNARRS